MRLLADIGRVAGTLREIRVDPRTAAAPGYEVQPAEPHLLQRLRREQGFLPVDTVEQYGADALIVREEYARRRLRLDTYGHYAPHARAIRQWRERRPIG